jgi:predicted ATP-dependent endonuclease of OLD family
MSQLGFDSEILDRRFAHLNNRASTKFVQTQLQNIFTVPVPRGISEFKSEVPTRKVKEIVTSSGLSQLTKNLLSAISYDVELVEKISDLIEDIFGKRIRYLPVPENIGISQRISFSGSNVGTVDFFDRRIRSYASATGFGLNQLLLLFIQLLDAPVASTILIEEPEISLHPVAQKKLAEILVEIAKKQNKQLIMTTHSEHIAFALFGALKNGKISEDDLTIYSFNAKKAATGTSIKRVKTLHDALERFLGGDPELILWYVEAFGKKDEWISKGTVTQSAK